MALNKVILIGNVGKDPVIKYFDSGNAVANFTLATSERGYTLANGTEVPEQTEWHNIVLSRGLAEVAEKYVRKGSKLFIEGKIRTRTYDDASGNKRYITEILGNNMEMLDRKSDQPIEPLAQSTSAPQPQSVPPPTEAPVAPPPAAEAADDLPF